VHKARFYSVLTSFSRAKLVKKGPVVQYIYSLYVRMHTNSILWDLLRRFDGNIRINYVILEILGLFIPH